DITDLRQAEVALRRQAELLRLSYDAIIVWRLGGGIENWSRGAEELYGFTEAEVLGRGTHELLRTIHPVRWGGIEAKILADGTWEGELRHWTKAGSEVIVSSRHQLVRDADGVQRVLETNRDITAHKRAEEALRESEERFRGTFENAAVGITHTDLDGRWLCVNEKLGAILGYTVAETRRLCWQDVTYPDDLPASNEQVAALLQGEQSSYSLEKRYVRKDGSVIWGQLAVSLQRDAAGQPAYYIVVIQDVSERKRLEG